MQNFNVDISTSHISQTLYVKQGDSLSRFFALTVADNGSPWEPPENSVYTIRFSTSAGTGWYDTIQLVGGTTRPAVNAAGNVLTCEVAEQATLGNGQLCVMVNDAIGYQLGMWNLNIIAEVVPGANSPEAENYYGVLAGQIAQALAAEQGATEQANLAKQYADSIDPSQFATQTELDAKTTGHVIQDSTGESMPQRENLKFSGKVSVTDDEESNSTDVTILDEVDGNTSSRFEDGQILSQQDGKLAGIDLPTPSVVSAFGQIGGAAAGSFEIYGKITGTSFPGGLWRVDFSGKIETNGQPSGAYGLNLSQIASLLGTTLAQVDKANTSWFAYTSEGTPPAMNSFGYGGNLTLSQGFLMPGRYYQTDGASGTWGANTGVATVGNYWTGYFFAK